MSEKEIEMFLYVSKVFLVACLCWWKIDNFQDNFRAFFLTASVRHLSLTAKVNKA